MVLIDFGSDTKESDHSFFVLYHRHVLRRPALLARFSYTSYKRCQVRLPYGVSFETHDELLQIKQGNELMRPTAWIPAFSYERHEHHD